VLTFGEAEEADCRLLSWSGDAEGVSAEIGFRGATLPVRIGAPGHHMALNACSVLAAVAALGEDVGRAAAALALFGAGAGRGERVTIRLPGGSATLIDDSYNASPASIRAGLGVLAAQPARRRIVALGEMRELGDASAAMHEELAPDVAEVADLVFCCGAMMAHLFEALPPGRRGAQLPDSAALAEMLAAALRPGDAVLVKGSLGSRMALVVAGAQAFGQGWRRGRRSGFVIFNLLAPLGDNFILFNLFRYLTFRAGAACMTALFLALFIGPSLIRFLRARQNGGQPIREDGPQGHLLTKKGTPTMGGLLILTALTASTLLWADLATASSGRCCL
jgi:hypothetical protein